MYRDIINMQGDTGRAMYAVCNYLKAKTDGGPTATCNICNATISRNGNVKGSFSTTYTVLENTLNESHCASTSLLR